MILRKPRVLRNSKSKGTARTNEKSERARQCDDVRSNRDEGRIEMIVRRRRERLRRIRVVLGVPLIRDHGGDRVARSRILKMGWEGKKRESRQNETCTVALQQVEKRALMLSVFIKGGDDATGRCRTRGVKFVERASACIPANLFAFIRTDRLNGQQNERDIFL